MDSGELPPLVLLHGVAMSGFVWDEVVPLVSTRHRVYAPTAVGHLGGPVAQRRPATVSYQVDWAESYLDEQNIERAHLAGNSMGAFVVIELARRGRALSVSAFAPGGFWSTDDASMTKTIAGVRRAVAMTRLSRPIAPLLMGSAALRRFAMRNVAEHGDRLTKAAALRIADETLGCTVTTDVLASGDESEIALLDPLPCPITIAWSEKDALVPAETHPVAQQRIPSARFVTLKDCGHVPMIDDPRQVARVILETTGS
jgi:pimeloyl-ACP methyl ester carboxylesterase